MKDPPELAGDESAGAPNSGDPGMDVSAVDWSPPWIRLREEDEERRVRGRDAVFRREGRQFRDDTGTRSGVGGLQERMDSREDPLTFQQRLDRNVWTRRSDGQRPRHTRGVRPGHPDV